MKRLLVLLVMVLVSFPLLAIEPSNQITAANVLQLMNDARAAAGLPLLQANENLDQAASDRMRHMEDESYWSHESPSGVSPFVWLTLNEYDYRSAGENLANGFETAGVLVQSWMESPGHRANILSDTYDECGIAIIDGSTLGPATGKSIVVLFGSRRPDTAQVARTRR